MPNMASFIQQHNTTIVRKRQPAMKDDNVSRKNCNCCIKDQCTCPLESACLTLSIVYKATIMTDNDQKEYISASQ